MYEHNLIIKWTGHLSSNYKKITIKTQFDVELPCSAENYRSDIYLKADAEERIFEKMEKMDTFDITDYFIDVLPEEYADDEIIDADEVEILSYCGDTKFKTELVSIE